MEICDHYNITRYNKWNSKFEWFDTEGIPECYGTKERDRCSCGGDPSRCDFYSKRTEKAKQTQVFNEIRQGLSEAIEYEKQKGCPYCNGEYHTEIKALVTKLHSNDSVSQTIEECKYCPFCGAEFL